MSEPNPPTLTSLVGGVTTSRQVHKFRAEMHNFAQASNTENGPNGNLQLITNDAEFSARTNGLVRPPLLLDPAIAGLANNNGGAVFLHKEALKKYQKQCVDNAKLSTMMANIMTQSEHDQLKLANEYRHVSAWEPELLLRTIVAVFGRKSIAEVKQSLAQMSEPKDPNVQLAATISEFNECKEYLRAIGEPVANLSAVAMMMAKVGGEDGEYHHAIRTFTELQPAALQTVEKLGELLIQEMYRLRDTSAASTGFAAAAGGQVANGGGRGTGRGNSGANGGGTGNVGTGAGGATVPYFQIRNGGGTSMLHLCWSCGVQAEHASPACSNPEQGHKRNATFASPQGARIQYCDPQNRARFPHK
jgi:hypothetical protein